MKFFIVCLFCLFPNIALSGPRENDAYLIFERYCLLGMTKPDQIPEILSKNNAMEVSKGRAEEHLRQPGRLWFIKRKSNKFSVFLTDTGACGIQFVQLDFNTVKTLFEERTLNRPIEYSEDDKQVTSIYWTRVRAQDDAPDKLMAVTILGGKLATTRHAVTMSTIPKASFDRLGVRMEWPKQCAESSLPISGCNSR